MQTKIMDISHFNQSLQDFLKPRDMLKEKGNNPHWNDILQYTYENFQFVTDINALHACNNILLKSLIEFECSDENVLARILKMSWNVSNERRKAKMFGRFHRTETSHNLPFDSIVSPLNLANQEDYSSLELWSWWKTTFAVEFSDLNLMRVLIKYGLYYAHQDGTYYDLILSTDCLANFW